MSDEVVMLTTSPVDNAPSIARALVERRLAACVNLLPQVRSVYRWQGAVEEADEVLMVVKSMRQQVRSVDAALRELHPYEVYELVVLPVEGGAESYLEWIRESVE